MNAALLGGTKGIGRSLARQLACRGDRLFLLGRDMAELDRSAADLEARAQGSVAGVAFCDLTEPDGFDAALATAEAGLGGLDAVIVTAGAFDTQEDLEADPDRLARVLDTNFTGSILFAEAARRRLLAAGGGTLCMFSSVAGDRARKSVVLYGATKAGLSYYLDGLDVRYRSDGLRTVCIRPGFVRTGMTAGLPEPPFAADPDTVARRAIRAIDRGEPVTYAPGIWRLVMAVVRRLPRFVRRRVEF